MPYPYYQKLSEQDKSIYRQSDRIERVPLHAPELAWPGVQDIKTALERADRRAVQAAAQRLVATLVEDLDAPEVMVKVLSKRPSQDWGELQGLYEPEDEGEIAVITVWMRTAAHMRVVAFKTFLRTILHELCHHLDYEVFELEDSFHTEGFFKRESSLFHQIVAAPAEGDS